MQLISVYESFLYYCCLLLIVRNVFGICPRIIRLCFSFSAFIPLMIISYFDQPNLHSLSYLLFGILQFLMILSIFPGVKMYCIISCYVQIYCFNVIIISFVATISDSNLIVIDLIVNTLTALMCVVVCSTNIRFKIRQIMDWVPKYILVTTTLLLALLTIVSVLVFGYKYPVIHSIWSNVSQLTVVLLQFCICIVLSILALNAISVSRLKALTENYEQQIYAQAEHYKNLAAANLELRRFKHDFQNTRIAIEKLLADGDHAQALTLMQQCGNAMERPGGLALMFDTGNGIADALLTDKQTKADACNARIVFSGAITPNYLSPTDLCVILGNTLDNAIEACEKINAATAKIIRVNCSCSNGFLFLSVCNPIGEKVVIRDNHIATTKENKTLHGFGLYSLQSVVKRYDGEVKLSSTEDAFIVEIALCLTSVKEPSIQHAN